MILNSIRMYRTDSFTKIMVKWFLPMTLNITGEETISLITKLVVKEVEKTIIKIGMQSSTVLIKSNQEFKENLPCKYLEIYGAEADDIILTLCKNLGLRKNYDCIW